LDAFEVAVLHPFQAVRATGVLDLQSRVQPHTVNIEAEAAAARIADDENLALRGGHTIVQTMTARAMYREGAGRRTRPRYVDPKSSLAQTF
jgi:hypothetical protein